MAGIQAMSTKLELKQAGGELTDTEIKHITTIGEVSGEAEEIDVTTLDSPNGAKEFMQGAKDAGSLEITANNCFDGQVAKVEALYKSGEKRKWVVTYPDSKATLTVEGYVSAFTYGEVTTDGLLSITFTIRLSGDPVYAEPGK